VTDSGALIQDIERLYQEGLSANREHARATFAMLREELSTGRVRCAEPDPSTSTGWRVNAWVKKGILIGFRFGDLIDESIVTNERRWFFSDKDTCRRRQWTCRWASGWCRAARPFEMAHVGKASSACRRSINIGAYVGEASLSIRMRSSDRAQVAGACTSAPARKSVAHRVGRRHSRHHRRRRAHRRQHRNLEGAVIKTRGHWSRHRAHCSTPIYDLVRERIVGRKATRRFGTRRRRRGARGRASLGRDQHRLSLATPVIRNRDEKTDAHQPTVGVIVLQRIVIEGTGCRLMAD
jgi:2,3,4,5-tetrahydropyridine-2-carboxylate N-succinyltransferase